MKEQTLYFECYSGISGDMTVAALLDLGANREILLEGLESLHVEGYQIEIGRRLKNSIDACDFKVILEPQNLHHHHHDGEASSAHIHARKEVFSQTEDSYGHEFELENQGGIIAPHNHPIQEHVHAHSHHSEPIPDEDHDSRIPSPLKLGHHEHRNLSEIYHIIEQSKISDPAKALAKKIFHIIAVAEAKAHSKSIEEVHFHEVGAIDSIVDIVAVAICVDNLNIKEVIVSELYEGTGQIKCQHGYLPIPVPAVINIAAMHQLPLHITGVQGELVTPTGAAIVAALKTKDQLPKQMHISKIGLGAGKRNYNGASGILRAMLIEESESSLETDSIWVLEANLDDCTGEALAYTMELLFEQGAKDVYYTPIYMKKNRPAYLLGVLCKEEDILLLEQIIFTQTTTIGIRKQKMQRSVLQRELHTIMTSLGEAQVKVCYLNQVRYAYPEYESVKQLSKLSGLAYPDVYRSVQNEAEQYFRNKS